MVAAPLRRELVRWLKSKGLSERRSLLIAKMSASAMRYQPRPDSNVRLRERIVSLPMFPELDDDSVDRVIDAVRAYFV